MLEQVRDQLMLTGTPNRRSLAVSVAAYGCWPRGVEPAVRGRTAVPRTCRRHLLLADGVSRGVAGAPAAEAVPVDNGAIVGVEDALSSRRAARRPKAKS
jgi:hypothetical protein